MDWPPISPAHLVAVMATVVAAHGLHGLAWAVGARQIAPRLGWGQGVAAYSLSFLGRYLPGKIWQVGGLSYLARDRGAEPWQIAGYSLAFLVAFQVVGAALLALAMLLSHRTGVWLIALLASPVIGIALALLYRWFSEPVFRVLPARLQTELRGALAQPTGALAVNLGLLGLTWVLLATCGHLLVAGFAPDWPGTWAQSAAATIGGLIAGFLVLIAPSGAGVREATISVWLTSYGVEPVATLAVVVALRIAMTLGDLIWALIGLILMPRNRAASPAAKNET